MITNSDFTAPVHIRETASSHLGGGRADSEEGSQWKELHIVLSGGLMLDRRLHRGCAFV